MLMILLFLNHVVNLSATKEGGGQKSSRYFQRTLWMPHKSVDGWGEFEN